MRAHVIMILATFAFVAMCGGQPNVGRPWPGLNVNAMNVGNAKPSGGGSRMSKWKSKFQGAVKKVQKTNRIKSIVAQAVEAFMEPLKKDGGFSTVKRDMEKLGAAALEAVNKKRSGSPPCELKTVHSANQKVVSGTVFEVCMTVKCAGDAAETKSISVTALQDKKDGAMTILGAEPRSALYPVNGAEEETITCVDGIKEPEPKATEERSKPNQQSASESDAADYRFRGTTGRLRGRSGLWTGEHLDLGRLPNSFDWRDAASKDAKVGTKCAAQINQIYNQGHCGSCYAFAVAGANGDRHCIAEARADKTPTPVKLAPQDMLACGTVQHGKICVSDGVSGLQTTKYANNCDGGYTVKVHEYAQDKGLVPDACHPFHAEGNAVNHMDVNFGDATKQECRMRSKVAVATKLICKSIGSVGPIAGFKTSRLTGQSGLNFCDCPEDDRENWEKFVVEKVYKDIGVQCVVKNKGSTALANGFTLKCKGSGVMNGASLGYGHNVAKGASIPLGTLFERLGNGKKKQPEVLTTAGRLCRCAPERREGADWAKVTVEEQGAGALRQKCKRTQRSPAWANSMSARQCKPVMFHQPTNVAPNVDAIKRAILHGGPVTASMKVYDDFQELRVGATYQKGSGAEYKGGHALVLIGWGNGYWLGRNSWGNDWPRGANPSTAGIFKIKLGSNEAEIEEKVMFSLAGTAPRGGGDGCAFVTQDGGTGGNGRSCLTVTNAATSCTVKNTCDSNILITASTSNSIGTTKDKCSTVISTQENPSNMTPKRERTFEGLIDCCILEAEKNVAQDAKDLKEKQADDKATKQESALLQKCVKMEHPFPRQPEICVITNNCQWEVRIENQEGSGFSVTPKQAQNRDTKWCSNVVLKKVLPPEEASGAQNILSVPCLGAEMQEKNCRWINKCNKDVTIAYMSNKKTIVQKFGPYPHDPLSQAGVGATCENLFVI